jgi:hypothetical protein
MEKFAILFGTFYVHLVILWHFDIFSPVLVYCVEKIWQPCVEGRYVSQFGIAEAKKRKVWRPVFSEGRPT